MLRRFFIVMLMIGLGAGLMAPGQAGSAGMDMDCGQVSLQLDMGCGGESMAATPCSVPCPAGACMAPTLVQPQVLKAGSPLLARAGAQAADSALAPDSAPPKRFIA